MFNKNHHKQNSSKEVHKDMQKQKKKTPYNSARQPVRLQKREIYSKIEWPKTVCEKCGKEIKELNTALSDKNTGKPIHFDCVLEFIKNSEQIKEDEEVIYIGNGNFAIVTFENPKIRKSFKIVKSIEWEERNKIYQWKDGVKKLSSST